MAIPRRTRLQIAQSSGQTNRTAAEQALAEGTQLYQHGTEESLLHAIEKFTEALKLSQEVGDKGGEANALNNIATVYENLGEKEQALDYYNQVLPLLSAKSDRANKAVTLNNIGYVYSDLGDNQKALLYYNQAFVSSKRTNITTHTTAPIWTPDANGNMSMTTPPQTHHYTNYYITLQFTNGTCVEFGVSKKWYDSLKDGDRAFGIFLKALWDTTFVGTVSAGEVIAELSSDVQLCSA